ncbi:MAG: VanZ family protein [Bacteroidales bacterium]|nr:VanZ family protein [Bacteroidales bacterium]MBN2699074.1 VanZ family protein [Bacteroidales bacterium]
MFFFAAYLYKYKFTIVLGILIILLSLLPSSTIPSNPVTTWSGFDKLAHFFMYTALSFTIFIEMRCKALCFLKYLLVGLFILIFSSLLELFQKLFYTLERSAEIADFLANLFGIISGFTLFSVFRWIKS